MHLQHGSLPFLQLASRFTTFWLGRVQKSKFWDRLLTRRWPTSLSFSIFDFFPLSFSFCRSDWPSPGLACSQKTSKKASSRWAIFAMEQPDVVAGNFALSFSLDFLSIFVHISGFIRPITLIWASLERSFPPAEVEYRWCQFWSIVMTSEVEERPRLVTAGYGRHGSQWVNGLETKHNIISFLKKNTTTITSWKSQISQKHPQLVEREREWQHQFYVYNQLTIGLTAYVSRFYSKGGNLSSLRN